MSDAKHDIDANTMKWIDGVAAIVYAILLPVHIIFTRKSLKLEAMRNVYNLTISLTILLVILIRLGILLKYMLTGNYDTEQSSEKQIIDSLSSYLKF